MRMVKTLCGVMMIVALCAGCAHAPPEVLPTEASVTAETPSPPPMGEVADSAATPAITPPPLVPEREIILVAKVLRGECYDDQLDDKREVVRVICNRVGAGTFGDSIEAVITAPHQFAGYKPGNEPTANDTEIAREILTEWYAGGGPAAGRVSVFHGGRRTQERVPQRLLRYGGLLIMKTGRTLQDLAIELDRQAAAKRDYVVGSGRMGLNEQAEQFNLYPEDAPQVGFAMSGLFERQLGAALGIPAKYYDKMRAEYPELLARNVNGWFERTPSKHTVRTLDGRVRAFLSDRYRRIDNYDIANAALPVIGEMSEARVESCEVTETRMYLKIVNTRLTAEVKKGDAVQAGIVISNSEVGLGSVSVMPLVFRLACLNGMVVQDYGQRKYHVGRENEEAWELYSDDTLRADDTAFMKKLADVVRTAVDEARFAMVVDKLREAADARIAGHVPQVVELTAQQFGMSRDEESGILQHLIAGGDLSLWGLSNAVTRASQDVADYDRATALEGVGWQVATMPGEQWRMVNGGAG